ncbi:glutathione-dependent formaldehyde-activating protein [Xylariales sp. PMI_506]|nr:glutathione-dependent formaldehyde-activating protein [Xylariales sp. PMI_506]
MATDTSSAKYPLKGRCDCGDLTYLVESPPITVNCCHCRICQRQTGSSFALHALIEPSKLAVTSGHIEDITVETGSGAGQTISRCTSCRFAVWSHYLGLGAEPGADGLRSLDVGTLDHPDILPPNFHIYTRDKQPWIVLSEEAPAFAEFYNLEEQLDAEQVRRIKSALKRSKDSSEGSLV